MARKINTKPGKYKVAVIGEGITEWHYFDGLRSVERLSFDLKPGLPRHSSYGDIFKKALEFIGEG
ncbi:MAG TPA: hypothetical protein PKE06_04895 [Flavilitoribacter sp.]|nr:hypothetical protein [Flavilitoribacter sp.]HMQ87267.1 hypothetical protein [Flavilitoribacter sp.]